MARKTTLAEQAATLEDMFDRNRAADPNARVISVRGAREHNLKNIDLRLPRDSLIVMTGLSGSGKSSLAFDTIYAEGQRRYVESLSAYARQFLEMMQKPDVEQIDGLSPAISIEQKTTSRNPRSTVGTVTEIYDYLRLLFARVGIPYSPVTGLPIQSQTVSQMVDIVMAQPPETRLYLLAPIARGRKGEYKRELNDLMRKGFQRVKIDGEFHDIEDAPNLDKKIKHDIEVVVDRVVVGPDIAGRLAESFETALKLADGIAFAEFADELDENGAPKRLIFSEKFADPISGFTIPEIEPRLFSFNNPFGACPVCDGLGTEQKIDPNLIVPDVSLSLRDGAILPWSKTSAPYYLQTLQAVVKHFGASTGTAWEELPFEVQHAVLFGTSNTAINFVYDDGLRTYKSTKPFEGVIGNLERRYKETESAGMREEIEKYMSQAPCVACSGYRLKPEALAVKIDGLHIAQVSEKSIKAAAEWFTTLPQKLTEQQNQIGERIFKEIRERLGFLNDVGLDYLTLARNSGSLSGGESQRIRLASQIGSGLTGVLYVLDEPSIGPAPARQCAPLGNAAAAARYRQHGDRGRARRGRDPPRRLRGRYWPGGRRQWRPYRRRGLAAGHHPQPQEYHRPSTCPARSASRCQSSGASRVRPRSSISTGRPAITSRTYRSTCRSAISSPSPASPVAASRP
jgi:excinuclease ABC subunit A